MAEPKPTTQAPRFVLAFPSRTSQYGDYARALHSRDALRMLALGTRRGVDGVPDSRTQLCPAYGLLAYGASRSLGPRLAEEVRAALFPLLDHWVARRLRPGDHVISSFGYMNRCFSVAKQNGGHTFLEAGNSHPEHYWEIIQEEHRRWCCDLPPFPWNWYRRAMDMMPLVDYVLSPSSSVTRSFLERGFRPGQILRTTYTVDFSRFRPCATARPVDRPLTLICTGVPSLRKGTPYLLEAFRKLSRSHPGARLLLTGPPHPSLEPLLHRWADLRIDWAPSLPHDLLAERLRRADIFVLPSLEEGLVRTACEAMACGLPVVLTDHTGAHDLMTPGVHGEMVPIRDSEAIVDAVERCFDRLLRDGPPPVVDLATRLGPSHFEEEFLGQLDDLGLL